MTVHPFVAPTRRLYDIHRLPHISFAALPSVIPGCPSPVRYPSESDSLAPRVITRGIGPTLRAFPFNPNPKEQRT